MTDDRLSTDWADARLTAAFAARSGGRPAPSDLVPAIIERLRVDPRPVRARFGFAHLGGAAAAAVVLAVVAVGVFGPHPTTEPGETHAATFGLEPITVSEAMGIRDGGVDGRELAVAGYYATAGRVPCVSPPDFLPLNPTRPWCPMTLNWLMERPEQLVNTSSAGIVGRYPSGPAFNPSLALVDPAGLPQDASTVAPVTFIGHFDDRRAEFCPDDERSSCADTFVVDRIAILDGRLLETTTVRELETPPESTAVSIDGRVRSIDPDLRVLSRRVTTADRLLVTEPAFLGRRGLLDPTPDPVWLVVALPRVDSAGRAVARTFLIPDDGSDPILEITRDGEVPVTESAPPATSPTPTTIVGDPITVADAIDHRDHRLDDTELAVAGLWFDRSGMIRCALVQRTSPVQPGCQWRWISGPAAGPEGKLDQPVLDAAAYIDPAVTDQVAEGVPVIAIGHFDDRRAAECPGGQVETCRKTFIVDALLGPSNPTVDAANLETVRPDSGVFPLADLEMAVSWAGVPRAETVLAAFPVGRQLLRTFEPAVASAPELDRVSVVWIVRFVDRDAALSRAILRTVLVPDRASVSLGFPVAYEVTGAGLARRPPASSIPITGDTVNCGGLPDEDCRAAAAAVIAAIVGEPRTATTIEMESGLFCPDPSLADTTCPGAPMPWRGADPIGSALVSYEDEPAKSFLNLYRDESGIKARFIVTAIAPG